MTELISSQDIISELSLIRSTFGGVLLIVEGSNDIRFFKRFIDEKKCKIIPAYGKRNTLEVINTLNKEKFTGSLAIIDADFNRINKKVTRIRNLCFTDFHDVEMQLYKSTSFDNFVEAFCNADKVKKVLSAESSSGMTLADILIDKVYNIGLVKLISEREYLSIKFAGIKYKGIVNIDTLAVDIKKYIGRAISNTPSCTIKLNDIYKDFRIELMSSSYNKLQLCNGHDVTEIFAISLKKLLSNQPAQFAKKENIEKILMIGFDKDCFKSTKLCKSIKRWQKTNSISFLQL